MTSLAQIISNRKNAQLSTGPVTDAGKAAVSQNRTTHNLAGTRFLLLPGENPEEFHLLLEGLTAEFQPATTSESFLVEEIARAQWKLRRIEAIEHDLLTGNRGQDSLARFFDGDSRALDRLARYEAAIRRNWYRARKELRDDQRHAVAMNEAEVRSRRGGRALEAHLTHMLDQLTAPPPIDPEQRARWRAEAIAREKNDSKPMPEHLAKELAAHKRRDPDFDPVMDASQLSKELRRWFERNPPPARVQN